MTDYLKLDTDALEDDGLAQAFQRAASLDTEAKRLQATYRDALVARMLAEPGATQKQVAALLGVSQKTISKHLNRHKERTMWTVPDALPIRDGDENGQADQPAGHVWWIKVVHCHTAGPSRVYVMRQDQEWLGYECAGDPRTDQEQLGEGIHAASTIAQLLAGQVPVLDRVGREVGARGDGTVEDWRAASDQWRPAISASWSDIKGVLPTSGLTWNIFARWAEGVMRGDHGGPNALL